MQKYAVLIVGMGGLGVEVAKNVILAGVKSVAIHDLEPTALSDLSSQFYLSEAALGMPRAAACVDQLKELNQYVSVSLVTEPLTSSYTQDALRVFLITGAKKLELQRPEWPANRSLSSLYLWACEVGRFLCTCGKSPSAFCPVLGLIRQGY